MDLFPVPTGFERILSISAHPDDSEFFAGGTLAMLAMQGATITLVVCTDGAKGGRNLDDIVRVRHEEQTEAARRLGISKVLRLGYGDGELTPSESFRQQLIELIRQEKPDLVLVHHPRTFYKFYGDRAQIGHSDHRAAGTALLEAVYPRAGSPNFSPGLGGDPWSPAEIWLFDCEDPNHLVDIRTGMDQKVHALEAHRSQHGAGGGLPAAARRVGALHGSASRPAEAFVRLTLRSA